MKSILYALSITLFLAFTASVQTFAQEQLQHEKKFFKTDENRIYWNLELPVYLRIGNTADGSGSLMMEEVMTDDMKEFAIPMKFDGHGVHYIRHLDYEKNLREKEIAFAIYVDGYAPKTSLKLSGAPQYKGEKLFYGKNLTGEITSSDEMSGVESTYQSINGAAYATYNSTLPFNSEGDFAISSLS